MGRSPETAKKISEFVAAIEPAVIPSRVWQAAGLHLLDGLATKVRQEPGNIAFDCYRRAENPAKFLVYEIYRDRQAFEDHIAADYGAAFNTRLQELIIEPQSILTFLTPLGTGT